MTVQARGTGVCVTAYVVICGMTYAVASVEESACAAAMHLAAYVGTYMALGGGKVIGGCGDAFAVDERVVLVGIVLIGLLVVGGIHHVVRGNNDGCVTVSVYSRQGKKESQEEREIYS